MRVKFAYLGVLLIWSTTPLGIKWSGEGFSYVLGLTARMSIGIACLLLIMLLIRQRLPLHSAARRTYFAASVQLYLAMLITYWAAQYIPSGWMTVIFGLSPFITAVLAAIFLKERSLGWGKVMAYLLGMVGLLVMCLSAWDLNRYALLGIAAMLASTTIHAISAVWVKRINAGLTALQQVTGGLLFSLPLYFISWYVLDKGQMPDTIPDKAFYAIVYLGVIATTLGFTLYYYILTHLAATHVALGNLITPVMSLLLGYSVNHEPLSLKIWIGTGLIMVALVIHQFAERRQRIKGRLAI